MPFYTPVYDKGIPVNDSYKRLTRVLVDSPDSWRVMFNAWENSSKKVVGFDTETARRDDVDKKYKSAALSCEHSDLVGCSLAFDMQTGYYLPFNHRLGRNLPFELFVEIEKILTRVDMVMYWNAKHDLRMQRKFGHKHYEDINAFDVANLMWNCDTNAGQPALKKSARTMLGWPLEEYSDTVGDSGDLSWLDPKDVVDYAAYDALVPLHIAQACKDMWKACKIVVDLDNAVVWPVMSIEDSPHKLSVEAINGLAKEIDPELEKMKTQMKKVLDDDGYDPAATATNGATHKALERLGLDTGVRTPKGVMAIGEEPLTAIKDQHEFVKLVLKYRFLGTLKSKINAMRRDYREDLSGVRFQYAINKVATGRFASGNGKKNPYFAGFGIQNVTKPKTCEYLAVPGTHICGWDFLQVSHYAGENKIPVLLDGRLVGVDVGGIMTEGFVPTLNLRRAYVPDSDDHVYMHVDYSSEELRIPTNMSKDKKMIEIFLTGLDMHRITAEEVFGKENYNLEARKKAKPMNFGLLYGGGPRLFAPQLGCSLAEAERYIQKWWQLYSGLKRWADAQIQHGKDYGYVATAFGRRRYVQRDYENGKDWFAKNVSLNSPVQGTAGDMMRLALVRIYDKLYKKYPRDKFRMLSMVHDEINFSVAKSILHEVMRDVAVEMNIMLPGWVVPMVAEFELGPSWGEIYPFELEGNTLKPSGEEIRVA